VVVEVEEHLEVAVPVGVVDTVAVVAVVVVVAAVAAAVVVADGHRIVH
jgi:hypothetical protein